MSFPSRNLAGFRAMLVLAAIDSGAFAAWIVLRPEQVIERLSLEAPRGACLLPALGSLLVLEAFCLAASAVQPLNWGGLIWPPLLGRLLNSCIWLWLLGAEHIAIAPARLLLAHEALWLPGFVVFLVAQRRRAWGQGVSPC